MQYLRLLSAIAITLCAGVFSIRADDTPQQAAARAALQQQMNAMDSGAPAPGSVPQPPPQPPAFQPAPAAPPIQETTPPPPPATPPIQETTPPPPAAPEQQTTLPQTSPPPAPAEATPNGIVVPPVEQANVPLPTNAATMYPVNPAMPQTNTMADTSTNWSTPPAEPAPSAQSTTPSAPISASQQQQLQQLLQQYMSNQITPAQYQQQRAAILKGQ